MTFPPAGEIDSESLAVFGRVADGDGDAVTVEVDVQGAVQTIDVNGSDGSFRLDDLSLAPGAAEVRVTATDATGQSTEQRIALQVGPMTHLAPAMAIDANGDLLFAHRSKGTLRHDAVTGTASVVAGTEWRTRVTRLGDDLFALQDGELFQIDGLDVIPLDPGVDDILAVSVEPTGHLALHVGYDYAVYRWDPGSGAPANLVHAGGYPDVLASGGDFGVGIAQMSGIQRLMRVDYATGESQAVFDAERIDALHVTDAGVWVSAGGQVHLLDPFTGMGDVLLEDDASIAMAGLDDDEVLVSVGNRVETLAADGQRTTLLDRALGMGETLPGCVGSVGPADSDLAYTLCTTQNGEQSVWTVSIEDGSRMQMGSLSAVPDVVDLAWDPAGERLLVLGATGIVRAVDPGTGAVTWVSETPTVGEPCTELVTDGTSAWAIRAVFDGVTNLVQYDLATGAIQELFFSPRSLAILPTSPPQLLLTSDSTLYALDDATQSSTELFTSSLGYLRGIHPLDEHTVVLGDSNDPTYQVVDLQSGVSESRPRPLDFGNRSAVLRDGVLYSVAFRTMTALDVQTGQAVLFSR